MTGIIHFEYSEADGGVNTHAQVNLKDVALMDKALVLFQIKQALQLTEEESKMLNAMEEAGIFEYLFANKGDSALLRKLFKTSEDTVHEG